MLTGFWLSKCGAKLWCAPAIDATVAAVINAASMRSDGMFCPPL
jgi:hypothetical protein